jgi:phage terminase large subunit-like protein
MARQDNARELILCHKCGFEHSVGPCRAARVIDFIEAVCRVPEGEHVLQKVRLRPWQDDFIRAVYRDEGPDVRTAILTMARKNGKTSLIAMLVLVHLVGPEAETNSEIYSAAQSKDQAAIVFKLAAKMVRMNEDLHSRILIRDHVKELFCQEHGVLYKALSAEATTAFGISPILVIHDELGQVRGPRSALYDALDTAQGAHAAPLSIIISTQAPTDADLLSALIDDALTAADPSTVVFTFAADVDDDPWSEATWYKANPALNDFRSLEDMTKLANKAKRLPSFESAFRNLNLNQRVAAHDHLLPPEVWKLNGGEPDVSVLDDAEVFAGLDLSARQDMTALVWIGREGPGGPIHIVPEFFAPEEGLFERARRDRQPYDLWRDEGYLITTPGRTVDYAWVAKHIAERAARCNLVSLRYDRWRIDLLKDELNKIGATDLPLEPFGQGYKDMAPAIDELEALALAGGLRHGMHPILTWNAANAVVTKSPAGDRKLDKSKPTGRIDGIVALAMAVAGLVHVVYEPEPQYQMWILGQGGHA